MKILKGIVYFVVNEGEIVYSTYDEDSAKGYAYQRTQRDMEDTAEELDMNIEELDDDSLAEVAFMSGFDGGYYYVASVELPSDADSLCEFVFETEQGDKFEYNELVEMFDVETEIIDVEF